MLSIDLQQSLLNPGVLSTFNQNPDTTTFVYCAPKLVSLARSDPTVTGVCSLDAFLLPTRIGTPWYAMLNATRYASMGAHEALGVFARSLTNGILFWDREYTRNFIRADREWVGDAVGATDASLAVIPAVEFDGRNHRMAVYPGCVMKLHVEWPQYNTLEVVSRLFGDDYRRFQMAGCADDSFGRILPPLSESAPLPLFGRPGDPLVVDTVMINNEVDLLLLRLEAMRGYCDVHIVVEAASTFTGKPKPLHFDLNKGMFAEHIASGRVVHVVIPTLLYPRVEKASDVWMNEYFSRNQVDVGLRGIGATDNDIIILADVDEIPHPRAVASVLAMQRYHVRRGTSFRRVYKLFPQNYMYDFECQVGAQEVFSAGAAAITTIGYAKSLPFKLGTPTSSDNFITTARMYQQSIYPYEYDMVLYPGGWHMSFFGGAARIKSKLESYSHQNFVRQFVPETSAIGPGVDSGTYGGGDCSGDTCEARFAAGKPVYDASGNEIIPKVLPSPDAVISTALIEEKIARRIEIDNREKKTCEARALDSETLVLKAGWETASATASVHQIHPLP